LHGGTSRHFGLRGQVNEAVCPRAHILREFGVGFFVRFFRHGVTSRWSRSMRTSG
jgi:hypothetical protein